MTVIVPPGLTPTGERVVREIPARRYRLTKVAAGDYLLPSNDAQTIFRIKRYVDGPSAGLDWPRDREVWGVWRWRGSREACDVSDDAWDLWTLIAQTFATRALAIEAALTPEEESSC